ncbi:glycosyltransferase [Alloalcanivorax sp. C16-1]|uniref:glycosyltransferase n=1 Tax=Alloalcanivorax sp. C16-1 TaxID=3390051 RepID=UPI0039706A41
MSRLFSFLLPDLRGGGAERVNLLLMHELLERGYSVDLVLLKKDGALLKQISSHVRIIDLQAGRVRNAFRPLMRYLQRQDPSALLVSMWPLTTIAVLSAKAARFHGRVVLVEHSALSRSPQNKGLSGFALRASMRWVNPLANSVLGVSSGVLDDLHGLGLPKDKGGVIYNPVAISSESRLPSAWLEHPWVRCPKQFRLLAVGALKPAKDYPTMLSAIKRLVDSGLHLSLLILGTGPLQGELEELCRSFGLEKHVHFGGFMPDPGPFYRAAGLFVLSSAWEGFGNVIVEALAAGTPVVSTDCRSGPAEILDKGRYGRLVPVADGRALAMAIGDTLSANHDVEALQSRANDFSTKKIGQAYLQVLVE